MTLRPTTTLALAAVLSCSACSESSNRTTDGSVVVVDGTVAADGGVTPSGTLTFISKDELDNNNAGLQAVIRATSGAVAVAYFRELEQGQWPTVTCPGQPPTDKQRPAQLLYASVYDGQTWSTPAEVDRSVGDAFGIAMAIDAQGAIHLGYAGGAYGLQECASSDAVIASSSDQGKAWNKRTVLGQGPVGDIVGHWMGIAVDSGGQVRAAYRDVHYGFYEQDGDARADLRYEGGESVSEGIGDGTYAALAFDSAGAPVIFHYNPTKQGAEGGLKLSHKSGGSWSTTQIVGGATRERPGFAQFGGTRFGLAFFEVSRQTLVYTESTDLTAKWPTPTRVDLKPADTGRYAALAFDSVGRPAISYYRCRSQANGGDQCDAATDALMFAYRIDGRWKTWEVDTGGDNFCGRYTSLAFDAKDQPIIAYQCVVFDSIKQQHVATLKIAKAIWK
ncbi:MAG: hypothetical protein H6707_13935 [Deltaproteobacteria bacterium]|nr:hypothetical protein [Deltaproteobacteria bacterium]